MGKGIFGVSLRTMVTQVACAVCQVPGTLPPIIGPVHDLVAVGDSAQHLHRQGGIGYRLEAHRHFAKIQIDVRDILPGLGGDGVQAEGIITAGEQIGGQNLIGSGAVGFVEDTVIEPGRCRCRW